MNGGTPENFKFFALSYFFLADNWQKNRLTPFVRNSRA
jgi:hypothetical protein